MDEDGDRVVDSDDDLVEVLVGDFEVDDLVEEERADVGNIKNDKSILFPLKKPARELRII